jgi:hypothetical protein
VTRTQTEQKGYYFYFNYSTFYREISPKFHTGLGPTQPLLQWEPDPFTGGKAALAWHWLLTQSSDDIKKIKELYRGADKSLARPCKETSYGDQDLQHYTKSYGVQTTGIYSCCLYAISKFGRCSLLPSRVGLRTYQHPRTSILRFGPTWSVLQRNLPSTVMSLHPSTRW